MRRTSACWLAAAVMLLIGMWLPIARAQDKPKPFRLPSVSMKEPILWSAEATSPEGFALAFGGADQRALDGKSGTRIKVDGEWQSISDRLQQANPRREEQAKLQALAQRLQQATRAARAAVLSGATDPWQRHAREAAGEFGTLAAAGPDVADADGVLAAAKTLAKQFPEQLTREHVSTLQAAQRLVERTADSLGAEPAPRALSPLMYDPASKLFVLFGGDHFDYLTNDTWTFDPEKQTWQLRRPKTAPPPRANHKLRTEDGKVVLEGGYTYTSNTGYVSGQYVDQNDGAWTYDVAANAWTHPSNAGVSPDSRTYRTGPFNPEFYLDSPAVDRAVTGKQLADLPANTWVALAPPKLPRLNRDWGTAVLDPTTDCILRYSGGHSAHGGTDVLHYHIGSNRWELKDPVEFPLGQLYTNTEYPEGTSFNGRPWITGHTYQGYGVDPRTRQMIYVCQTKRGFAYNPVTGDWAPGVDKPVGMNHHSCFYTLTLCPIEDRLFCWTQQGKLFSYDGAGWQPFETTGEKLIGSVVDNSTLTYDSKRKRFLLFAKPYGDKVTYTGEIQAVSLTDGAVTQLAPEGRKAAAKVSYLCQIRYSPEHDLCLAGCTLPPTEDGGLRRTPVFDCAGNRWMSAAIGGTDPSGPKGRNVSLGLMVDAKRKLFWAVDTDSKVFVLRLDPATADLRPLE